MKDIALYVLLPMALAIIFMTAAILLSVMAVDLLPTPTHAALLGGRA